MTRLEPTLATLACAAALAGCTGKADTFKGHKPAKLKHADETLLNQVILTEDAVKRLGLSTTPVSRRKMARRRSVGGQVLSPPGRSAVITAPLAGAIAPMRAGTEVPTPGSPVRAGQVVLRLSPLVTPNQNLQAEAQRDVAQAQARAENTERQATRLEQLIKEGAGNQAAAEQARAQASVAAAELRTANQRLARISGRNPLASDVSVPLRAPSDGVLMRLNAAPGQVVAPGTPLFEVASLSTVWVRVPLYVGDLPTLERGSAAGVLSLGSAPEQAAYEGVPLSVPAAGRGQTASADIFFEVSAPDHSLVPGQRVSVQLPLKGDATERRVVPYSAVLYDSFGGTWVYTQPEERTYERARIDVDYVVADLAVLNRGPDDGTPVVTTGAIELYGTEFGTGK